MIDNDVLTVMLFVLGMLILLAIISGIMYFIEENTYNFNIKTFKVRKKRIYAILYDRIFIYEYYEPDNVYIDIFSGRKLEFPFDREIIYDADLKFYTYSKWKFERKLRKCVLNK